MSVKLLLSVMCCTVFSVLCNAQATVVRDCGQVSFGKSVPAGNYSGITYLHGNEYAVVSDKSSNDGFFVFEIEVDTVSGGIIDVKNKGFRGDSLRCGDCEGIAFRPSSGTLFISREADSEIVEYSTEGKLTGGRLELPGVYKKVMGNYGFEALAYDESEHTFWTMNESTLEGDGERATSQNNVRNVLRLQSFGDDMLPLRQYAYIMDAPVAHSKSAEYAMGVSEIAALGDGRLLVLEREFFIPKLKIGAFVQCKLYEIKPDKELALLKDEILAGTTKFLPKRLVYSFKTQLGLFNRSIANYEGMCLGPTLADGDRVLILVSDSQNQYKGVLKDWFKSIVIKVGD